MLRELFPHVGPHIDTSAGQLGQKSATPKQTHYLAPEASLPGVSFHTQGAHGYPGLNANYHVRVRPPSPPEGHLLVTLRGHDHLW